MFSGTVFNGFRNERCASSENFSRAMSISLAVVRLTVEESNFASNLLKKE